MTSGQTMAGLDGSEAANAGHPPADLLRLLVCPACRGRLSWAPELVVCEECGRAFSVEDGIPALLLEPSAAAHDEIEHEYGHAHKHQQADYFDRGVAEAFEVRRPHGAPALYGWFYGEKFRRSIAGIEAWLPGATALTVCGGSGMDAEFLARRGARVIASDISLGAARRTRERARRFGVSITPIVADVEQLPFANRTVDVVYVHDGLHHLEQPRGGLDEMARVAARAVCVTEPARAAATALAVRLGLALEREEAGNRVARLEPADIASALRQEGFRIVQLERYAMYFKHEPGVFARLLSRPAIFPAATLGWRVANAAIGRLGNKLSVVAVRR